MNFLESMFHISPDGGSGVAEFTGIALFSIVIAAFFLRRLLWRTCRSFSGPHDLNKESELLRAAKSERL
jgi:hypothetical protein